MLSQACQEVLAALEAAAVVGDDGSRVVPFGTGELAQRLSKSHSTVTEQVSTLRRAGLVLASTRGRIELAPAHSVTPPADGVVKVDAADRSRSTVERISVLVDLIVEYPQHRDGLVAALAALCASDDDHSPTSDGDADRSADAEPRVSAVPAAVPRSVAAIRGRAADRVAAVSDSSVVDEPDLPVSPAATRAAKPRDAAVPVPVAALIEFENTANAARGRTAKRAGVDPKVARELSAWTPEALASAASQAARMFVAGEIATPTGFLVAMVRAGNTTWFSPGTSDQFVAPPLPAEWSSPPDDAAAAGVAAQPAGADETGSCASDAAHADQDHDVLDEELAAELEAFRALPAEVRAQYMARAAERGRGANTALVEGVAVQLHLSDLARSSDGLGVQLLERQ